ncbi:DUF1840 domain-containing protein [Uliginosibacterium sp. H1]|uniref:DUF1840 domain-containing protein n=1 Tax=Uliginosibacterium sp. H1 TaxID=3114757 RepID=UPI002E16FD5E|nr:DUF1840 domain-containing protein [Uliginosibacterium sp. H1]
MLITFQSPAGADVIMFGEIAQQLLQVLGKDPQDRQGIVTEAQLPAAISALQAAIANDRAQARPEPEDEEGEERPRGMAAPVSLAQRAVPLLDLLGHAQREGKPVTWRAS